MTSTKNAPIIVLLLCAVSSAHAFYQPIQGRWLSRDPIGEEDGPNRQVFCGNDPVRTWDASGLSATWKLSENDLGYKEATDYDFGAVEVEWTVETSFDIDSSCSGSPNCFSACIDKAEGSQTIWYSKGGRKRVNGRFQTFKDHEWGHRDINRKIWGYLKEGATGFAGITCLPEAAAKCYARAITQLSNVWEHKRMETHNRYDATWAKTPEDHAEYTEAAAIAAQIWQSTYAAWQTKLEECKGLAKGSSGK